MCSFQVVNEGYFIRLKLRGFHEESEAFNFLGMWKDTLAKGINTNEKQDSKIHVEYTCLDGKC